MYEFRYWFCTSLLMLSLSSSSSESDSRWQMSDRQPAFLTALTFRDQTGRVCQQATRLWDCSLLSLTHKILILIFVLLRCTYEDATPPMPPIPKLTFRSPDRCACLCAQSLWQRAAALNSATADGIPTTVATETELWWHSVWLRLNCGSVNKLYTLTQLKASLL